MSAIVSSLDKSASYNYGENGHVQHAWDYKTLSEEKVTQFYFQLIRCDDHSELEKVLNGFLRATYNFNLASDEEKARFWRKVLYKIYMNTRDVYGKGEYSLAFMMILCWYNNTYNEKNKLNIYTTKMIEQLVYLRDKKNVEIHPLGRWADIKYLCNYVKEKTNNKDHPIIMYCLEMCKSQYEQDMVMLNENDNKCSLFGKWMPREKSKKFGWIFKKYVRFYHMKSRPEFYRNYEKAAKDFRQNLSKLNKKIQTTEVYMCNKDGGYSSIQYNRVPTQCMRKNKMAFINKDKSGNQRSDKPDRVKGAENFMTHMENVRLNKGNAKVHGKRCHPFELVKEAVKYNCNVQRNLSEGDSDFAIRTSINAQWKDNSKDTGCLKNVIPMVDTSGSMECDESLPLYNSIALGIRVAQKNSETFANRILTFESEPRWVMLDENNDFVETVNKVRNIPWGGSTNFKMALDMILHAIVSNRVPPNEVENMVLAIFSDMQFDYNIDAGWNSQYENLREQFAQAGLNSVYKKPYNVPHILFWNLRKTNGFPSLSSEKNVTMLSGYSPTLINTFCEKGFDELKNVNGFDQLMEILKNERYDEADKLF